MRPKQTVIINQRILKSNLIYEIQVTRKRLPPCKKIMPIRMSCVQWYNYSILKSSTACLKMIDLFKYFHFAVERNC